MQQKLRNASEQRFDNSVKDEGTTAVLVKFQEQLVIKDAEITGIQVASKQKQQELETKLATLEKSSTLEISKLNEKLNAHEQIVVKYFDVENEMVSLRSVILEKDNQISQLRAQVTELGGVTSIPTPKAPGPTNNKRNGSDSRKRRGPPSPDKDLTKAFGERNVYANKF